MARTKNGTLNLTVDDFGLKVRADLSSSRESRELFEEIKAGLIDKMSFAFTVNEESYDKATRTAYHGNQTALRCSSCGHSLHTIVHQSRRGSFFEAEAERERAEARKALELAKAKYNFLEVK